MPKIYEGSRGGLYYIRKGRKIYVNNFGNLSPPVIHLTQIEEKSKREKIATDIASYFKENDSITNIYSHIKRSIELYLNTIDKNTIDDLLPNIEDRNNFIEYLKNESKCQISKLEYTDGTPFKTISRCCDDIPVYKDIINQIENEPKNDEHKKEYIVLMIIVYLCKREGKIDDKLMTLNVSIFEDPPKIFFHDVVDYYKKTISS